MTQPTPAAAPARVRPLIVGVGGALRQNSSTERALKLVLDAAAAAGADVKLISGPMLDLPLFAPESPERSENARLLVEALRHADGVVLGSPGYHGNVSGLVKNALDYTEDLRADPEPYFDGRVVGCVATGGGWQGAVSTLNALRGIVHALRGWNLPQGVVINTAEPVFDTEGRCLDGRLQETLQGMGREMVTFARRHRLQVPGGPQPCIAVQELAPTC
jgi:FMN reductase